MEKKLKIILILCLILSTFSCRVKNREPYFKKITLKNYPDFKDDMSFDGLIKGIDNSLKYYGKFKKDKEFCFGDKRIKKSDLEISLSLFKTFLETKPLKKEVQRYIKENFYLYSPVKPKNKKPMLFTGYYEPELYGSLVKTERYKYPLYIVPRSLLYVDLGKFSEKYGSKKLIARKKGQRIIPYFTNEEIVFENALEDEEALVWLDDKVELFFLQIQGSGKIYLEQGGFLRVHYAGVNGHSYKSIGRFLIKENKMTLEEMSMQNLKKYLENNPEEQRDILSYNKSYVFFETVEGGPYGALSQELVSGRSLASDLSVYPRGAVVYVKTKKPVISGDEEIKNWIDLERFMIIQDTGGAIKGHLRGDIFFGSGEYAETAAGHLAEEGELFLLLPRSWEKKIENVH